MTRGRRKLALAAVLLVGLGGCASTPSSARLTAVQGLVTPRLGQPVQWLAGGPEDAAVAEAIHGLLSRPLTAEAAVQMALLSNRGLRAEYEALGVAHADLLQAGLLDNPVLSAEFRFNGTTGITLDFVQNFLSLLTLPARRGIGARSFERAQLELAHKVLGVTGSVRATYYRLVADAQAIELFRQVVEATEAAAELAERQVQAGTLSRREQALHQALYARTVLELAEAETRFGVDREALNQLLGLWGPQATWQLPERLPEVPSAPPSFEGLEALAVTQRLDLAAARKHIEAAAGSLQLGRATRFLSLLGLGLVAERDGEGTWQKGPRLELGVPFFDGGQARVAGLEAEARRRAEVLAGLAIAIRSQVRETWQQLAAAQAAVAHYRAVLLPLNQEILEETQRLYNGMLVGVYDLLRSKQDQISTARDYIGALRRYWVARAELERVLGGPLPATASAAAVWRTAGRPVAVSATEECQTC